MRSGEYDTYRKHPSLRGEEKQNKNYCHEDKVGYIRYMLKIPDHKKIDMRTKYENMKMSLEKNINNVGYIRYMLKIPGHKIIRHKDIIRKKGNVIRKKQGRVYSIYVENTRS